MSVLKYRKPGESTWHRMTNMVLKAFNIVQTKGNSQEDVMSQKAVTDELALKQDASGMTDYYTKDDLTGSSAVTVALADSATTAESADTALSLIASSAATATTNDYAILEDSDGNPIKIKTDSLIQALSNILYSNNKGTSVSDALVRGTDGEFGATTMSNLASVLGVKDVKFYATTLYFNGTQTLNTRCPFASGLMILYSPSSGFGGAYGFDDFTFKTIWEGDSNKWNITSKSSITHTGGRCAIFYIGTLLG